MLTNILAYNKQGEIIGIVKRLSMDKSELSITWEDPCPNDDKEIDYLEGYNSKDKLVRYYLLSYEKTGDKRNWELTDVILKKETE